MDTSNIVKAKHYVNLYHMSIKLFKKILESDSKKIVKIASNCISLIAGLNFYLLQNYKFNYSTNYKFETNDEDYKVKFFIVNLDEIESYDQIDFYFLYEGSEQNILCLNQINQH